MTVADEHTLPVVTVTGGRVVVSVPAGGQVDGLADSVIVTGGAGGQLGKLQTPETVVTDVTVDGPAGGQLGDGQDEMGQMPEAVTVIGGDGLAHEALSVSVIVTEGADGHVFGAGDVQLPATVETAVTVAGTQEEQTPDSVTVVPGSVVVVPSQVLDAHDAVTVSTEAVPGIVMTPGEHDGAEAVIVMGTVAILPAGQDVDGQDAGEVTTDVMTDAEQDSVPPADCEQPAVTVGPVIVDGVHSALAHEAGLVTVIVDGEEPPPPTVMVLMAQVPTLLPVDCVPTPPTVELSAVEEPVAVLELSQLY